MERIQSINPERIEWCCADYGITPSILASHVGIAESSIKRVMSGEDSITFNQLRKIAEYFGRGILFFLETSSIDETRVHSPQFRTLANHKPELSSKLKHFIERVEKQRNVYLSLREELDDSDQPYFNPPELFGKNPIEAASIARQWLNLSIQNDFDSYREAVEAQGILVFLSNGYNGKWQIAKENPIIGFSLYFTNCPVIVIKKQGSEERQSFTLMHELGHLLLHKISSIDDELDIQSHKGKELEANTFAGNLLIPDDFLAIIQDIKMPKEASQYDEWLKLERKKWGVSGEAILLRLLNAERITKSQYTAYKQWKEEMPIIQKDGGNRLNRYREPKHVFGDTFVRTVFDALDARHITLAKASSYLDNLKIKDLHQLERHIASL